MDKAAEGSKPREQKSKRSRTFKGTEMRETTGLLDSGGSLLQGHSTGGERWAGYRQRELLGDTEPESGYRSRGNITGVQRPPVFMN